MYFKDSRYVTLAVLLGMAVYVVVAIVSLNEGHAWGGDFALYIAHAINLVDGRPYAETGFVQNPMYPYLSPLLYPPGTPFLLAPVYAYFGFDLAAMKAALVLVFGAGLLSIFLYFRRLSGTAQAALVVIALSLNPFIWRYREHVVSEYLFIFLFYLALLLLDTRESARGLGGRLAAAGCAGLVVYLASATREVGIVLIPAVILYDFLCRRRAGLDTALFVFVFLLGYTGQSVFFDLNMKQAYDEGSAGYAALLLGWSNLLTTLAHYAASIRELFPMPHGKALLYPFLAIMAVLVPVGLFREWTRYFPKDRTARLRERIVGVGQSIRLHDIAVAGYLLAIGLQPFYGYERYLMPLMPILLFYFVAGAGLAAQRLGRAPGRVLVAVLAATLAYQSGHDLATHVETTEGVTHPNSLQLFETVRTQLPEDALVIFTKPRVMALFGQRKSAIWPLAPDEESAWRNLAELAATHLVVAQPQSGLEYPGFLRYEQTPPPFLEVVIANGHFTLYRILRYPLPGELSGREQKVEG